MQFLWAILIVCSACSRTGLEVDELATGGSGPLQFVGTGGSLASPEPTTASHRWVGVPTQDASKQSQLFALRLGSTDVEDVVRLDPVDQALADAWGEFSRQGRGIAVSVSLGPDEAHASRLWDFDTPHPTLVELPTAPAGVTNRFGPWLDEHRIIVLQAPSGAYDTDAKSCLLMDLDHPTQAEHLDALMSDATCGGYFAVSPQGKWLAALARYTNGSQALLVAPIEPNGLGAFYRVADVPAGQTPAKVCFSPHEDYLALENVDLANGLLALDIPIGALGDLPAQVSTFHITAANHLNFVMWAPTGPRFFVHTSRVDASNQGSTPIFVADAETGAAQEVTARYFFASSRGFTSEGKGIITDAYDDGVSSHGMEWIRIPDLASPPQAASRMALMSNGTPVAKGFMRDDGSAFFGITGPAFDLSPNSPGPFDLNRFDFSPELGLPQLTVRLSEDAEVRRWLPSPKTDSLVYRVAVTSSVYSSADLLTQSHFTSEAGTYLLSLNAGKPIELAMQWNSYQTLIWLPDASGLLRLGPANATSVEMDSTVDDGQLTLGDPSLPASIFWLRLDGSAGALTDLTPYLGKGIYPSSLMAYVPEIWNASN